MHENSTYWMLSLTVGSLIITTVGLIASMNLPPVRRKIRIQKFGAVALALMMLSIPAFRPFISSYSGVRSLDELKTEHLSAAASPEDLVKFEKEQARQIERLKEEVNSLRDDLHETNFFYGTLTQIFGQLIVTAALIFAFRKRKDEDL